ncbi:MAG: cytidine deaminase [Ignavibacteriales bacterium]|nr:cytidine deaminase [Ignavibacteriales bacterium]
MNTLKEEQALLIATANLAKESAYAPYSNFRVGAALMTDEGDVFHGCNVENSSYSMTICAERNALFQAVAKGKKKFRAIAITSDDAGFITPCGACRQVLSEFNPDLEIILSTAGGDKKITTLSKLFPVPPELKKLARKPRKTGKK